MPGDAHAAAGEDGGRAVVHRGAADQHAVERHETGDDLVEHGRRQRHLSVRVRREPRRHWPQTVDVLRLVRRVVRPLRAGAHPGHAQLAHHHQVPRRRPEPAAHGADKLRPARFHQQVAIEQSVVAHRGSSLGTGLVSPIIF